MDKESIKESLKQAIVNREFIEARKLVVNFSSNEFSETICEIADDLKSMIVYAFMCYLMVEKELPGHHIIAAEILTIPLFSIPGAYNVALYHVKRALELDPGNISYMESLLFYYHVPKQLISEEEALKIAQDILKVKPDSGAALRVISDLMDDSKRF